jgi:hypothetical protein
MSAKLVKSIDRAIKALNELTVSAKTAKKTTQASAKKPKSKTDKCAAPKKATSNKPKKIDLCEKKEQVKKFTVPELKEWLKKHKIEVKNIAEKHKDDWVNIVWKTLKQMDESDTEDEDSSDSESDCSDSDSDSSDSDCSESDSD